jgi:hypothetical protein
VFVSDIVFLCSNTGNGFVAGFSVGARNFMCRTIVSFYHSWTSTSASHSLAVEMLKKEALTYMDGMCLSMDKPSFLEDLKVCPSSFVPQSSSRLF